MEGERGERQEDRPECPAPLTDREKNIIQDTWAKVYQKCDDVGVTILIRLFVNFPTAKQYFSQFKHVEEVEDLERSAQLRKHAGRVMNSINSLVENLHDADKMVSLLKLVGKAHALQHKVEPGYFKIITGVILEVLGEGFPDVVTPEVGEAWSKLMTVIYWNITVIYEELGWTKLSSSDK